jgi:hypothetical protein
MLAGLLKDHGMLTEHELLYGHPESAGLQLLHTLAGAVTDLIAGNNLSGYWQHKQFALQVRRLRTSSGGRGVTPLPAATGMLCVEHPLWLSPYTPCWLMTHLWSTVLLLSGCMWCALCVCFFELCLFVCFCTAGRTNKFTSVGQVVTLPG